MTTYQLGILGHPLSHTVSPALHRFFLEQTGLQGQYNVFDIPPASLDAWADLATTRHLKGFNVTIPYKRQIMTYLKGMDPEAEAVGAVNTICIRPEGWFGYNTDVYGFTVPLIAHLGKDLSGTHGVILGGGGASLAVAYALLKLNVAQLTFLVRNVEKMRTTIQHLAAINAQTGNATAILSTSLLTVRENALENAICIINTTPMGMYPSIHASPLPQSILATLPKTTLIYDLVYNPQQTQLLQSAAALGLRTQDGLSMLAYQGARSFELWTGCSLSDRLVEQAITHLASVLSH